MVKAQKEEPVDPKVADVLKKYLTLFNAPEQLPPTWAIMHQIKLFDEAWLLPKRQQYQFLQEESQEIRDNIDLYLLRGQIQPLCS